MLYARKLYWERSVGAATGAATGATTGAITGAATGATTGASIGTATGTAIGAATGAATGAVTGAGAGAAHTGHASGPAQSTAHSLQLLQKALANWQYRAVSGSHTLINPAAGSTQFKGGCDPEHLMLYARKLYRERSVGAPTGAATGAG
jgi:hypothetical protein